MTRDEAAALQAIADARTALDDPGGIPEEEMQPYVEEAEVMDRIYAEAARSPNIAYAIARLDEAVQLLYDEGTTPAHEQREQLLDDMAKVVLALQFAMRHTPDGHEAFQRILALVPPEIRGVEPPIPPVDELDPIEEGHDA